MAVEVQHSHQYPTTFCGYTTQMATERQSERCVPGMEVRIKKRCVTEKKAEKNEVP